MCASRCGTSPQRACCVPYCVPIRMPQLARTEVGVGGQERSQSSRGDPTLSSPDFGTWTGLRTSRTIRPIPETLEQVIPPQVRAPPEWGMRRWRRAPEGAPLHALAVPVPSSSREPHPERDDEPRNDDRAGQPALTSGAHGLSHQSGAFPQSHPENEPSPPSSDWNQHHESCVPTSSQAQ